MSRRHHLALITLLLATCCNTAEWHPDPSDKRLKIRVVWSAADSTQNYSATLAGANAAKNTDAFKKLAGEDFEVDDTQDPDDALEAAREVDEIRLNPRVLAVIGHSRSSSTRSAVRFYAEAGIPVLMPSATSPYALYQFREDAPWPSVDQLGKDPYPRFVNVFRLPPSDVPHQVNALKLTIRELSGLPSEANVMLICDVTKRGGADIYTKPICDSLRAETELKTKFARYREFDLDTSDIYGLVTEIHSVKVHYIAFIGYPQLALELLQELKERTQKDEALSNYTFIMSDACFTNELINFDPTVKVYVTSFIKPLEDLSCPSTPSLKTDEPYAFDAVMILGTAARSCKDRHSLDRNCIRQYLEDHRYLKGTCDKYDIHDGERQNAEYQVYERCGDQFQRHWSARFDEKVLREHAKWCSTNSK